MLKGLNLVPFESDPYSLLWDLRCLAREKLVAFMQKNDPQGIYPKYEKVLLGAEEGTPPILKGEGIMIYKLESSSSLVYWDGTRFSYYWQGD